MSEQKFVKSKIEAHGTYYKEITQVPFDNHGQRLENEFYCLARTI